jgi:hypothetical protein
MKKLAFLLIGAAALAAAGCSNSGGGVANTEPLKQETDLPDTMPAEARAQAEAAIGQANARRQMEERNAPPPQARTGR